MTFTANEWFPQLTEQQLRAQVLELNGVDKIQLNKALEEQMKLEKNKERGFIKNAIDDINNKIVDAEKQIVFYEKKISESIDESKTTRYEKVIIEIEKSIFNFKQEIKALEEELAAI